MSPQDRIFDDVFPPPSDVDAPTPTATPLLGPSAEGAPFGSPEPSQAATAVSADDQITWNHSWHVATSFLALPDKPIDVKKQIGLLKQEWTKPCSATVRNALLYLKPGMLGRRMQQTHLPHDDLLAWFIQSVICPHYVKHVLPDLLKIIESEGSSIGLMKLSHYLHIVLEVYLDPIRTHLPSILNDSAAIGRLEWHYKNVLTEFLPGDLVNLMLTDFFKKHVKSLLYDDSPDHDFRRCLEILYVVGLGGIGAYTILAEIIFEAMLEHVKSDKGGSCTPLNDDIDERDWCGTKNPAFVNDTVYLLMGGNGIDGDEEDTSKISPTDVQHWHDMGYDHLARLRTDQLFDIVIQWDESKSALEPLHGFVKSAAGRDYVVHGFNLSTAHRLLHPGASTIEILQVYVNVIRVFTTLDPKGVLLDRVSRPIRRYLRERDDTVSIVVAGLLADPELSDDDSLIKGDALTELTKEIDKSISMPGNDGDGDDSDLDFDDMEWTPDPVDARPGYKRPKSIDIITSLLSLFESRSVIVEEFQKALGERLLRNDFDFDREVRVLELLKLRIGESILQACEVMLRDIVDSRRVDSSIQKAISSATDLPFPAIHARILSHLFWPTLQTSETFNIPLPIKAMQTVYSNCFETIKASRKLTWLPTLGQVVVSLDLEDRTVTEMVQTWQAAVIYAFQPNSKDPDEVATNEPITRSLPYLVSHLKMSESLVLNALNFWIGKLVLTHPNPQSSPPTFTVLETLDIEDAATAAAAAQKVLFPASTMNTTTMPTAEPASAATATLSDRDVALEKMQLYKQYAIGMLTNGGPMGLGQIAMMLKMTVPGGYPFGNEELKEVLEGEVKGGALGFAGGLYRIGKAA